MIWKVFSKQNAETRQHDVNRVILWYEIYRRHILIWDRLCFLKNAAVPFPTSVSVNDTSSYSQCAAAPGAKSSAAGHETRHSLSCISGISFCSSHGNCPTACRVKQEQRKQWFNGCCFSHRVTGVTGEFWRQSSFTEKCYKAGLLKLKWSISSDFIQILYLIYKLLNETWESDNYPQ